MSEDSGKRKEGLQILKQWIIDEKLPQFPDDFLVLFLACRHDDVELAKSTIKSYLDVTSSTPELFSKRDPQQPEIQAMLPYSYFVVLPNRDDRGNVVIIYSLGMEDPPNFDMNLFTKIILMFLHITAMEMGPVPGYIVIADCQNYRMGYVTDIKLDLLKKCLIFVQEAMPMNIHNFHLINTHSAVKVLFNLAKPFINKRVAHKLQLYSNDLDSFYKAVPKNILPEEYGGPIESMVTLKKIAENKIMEKRNLLLEEEKLRIEKTKKKD